MTRLTLAPLLALVLGTAATAQETARDTSTTVPKSVTWRLRAAHLYQSQAYGEEVVEPRDTAGSSLSSVGDTPLYHGATWVAVGADVEVVAGVHLDGELLAEHRGASYGVYAIDEMIVVPRVQLAIDTPFVIAGEELRATVRVGNFSDIRWGEGLTFYNMDGQGSAFELAWRQAHVWRRHLGDAIYGIGLGVGDANDFGIGLRDVPIVDSLSGDATLSYINYFDSGGNGRTATLAIRYGTQARLYGQYELREETAVSLDADRSALLVGLSGDVELFGVRITGRGEWRRYGAGFNAGRIYRGVEYRGPGTTIGRHLYPLEFFDRPFSQWAVYTEYQREDVSALTLQLDARLRLPYGFVVAAELDLNGVTSSGGRSDAYDFFELGAGWEPRPGSSVMLGLTNRAMNLDRHYPTISRYREPIVQLAIRVTL